MRHAREGRAAPKAVAGAVEECSASSTADPCGAAAAAELIGAALDRPPALAGAPLRGDTLLTNRWAHCALHEALPGLPAHVVMTYYGAAREIAWRAGGRRLASRTRPGAVTLIPQGHDGRWDIAGPIEVSHVYLPDTRLQICAEALGGGRPVELVGRVGFDDPSTGGLLELLAREAARFDPASRLFVEQAVDLLCVQLVRAHSSAATPPEERARGGLADRHVRRVTEYMRGRLSEEIGLDELAGLVGLSRFHFCSAFKRATGIAPHRWLVAERMALAQRLLATTDDAVTEVALSAGYQTPSAFAAAFRRETGLTPSEFRRRR